MSKLLIWTIGNKVENNQPSERFRVKLDEVINQYHLNKEKYDEIEILVSGRWSNTTEDHLKTEARVGSEYIHNLIHDVHIIEENISLETIGNLAFSKQIIKDRKADKVIAIIQSLVKSRYEYLLKKIFANEIKNLETIYTNDNLTNDPAIQKRQEDALKMNHNLLDSVEDGDDSTVRNILLYKTPFYLRQSEKQNRDFFDKYWEGGFDSFIKGRKNQKSK